MGELTNNPPSNQRDKTMTKRIATTLSLFSIMQRYPTKEAAVAYFEQLRWGDSPVCTKCGCDAKITPQKKHPGRYWCGDCRSYFTALTGTPMEYGKVDLRKWIYASYLLMTARKGISALQLSKEIEVHYSTAWYMLHRLRVACGNDMEALSGEVEMDATYLGGKRKNMSNAKRKALADTGRGVVGKQPVLGVRERGGRTVAVAVDSESVKEVLKLARNNVVEGSTVYSDEARAYDSLEANGYGHQKVNHSAKEFVNGMASTNGIESVWAVLKRGFNGVYHNWSKKHCQRYVNEFAFRLNQGNCERDTQDRLDDLFRAMVGKTITYSELTA
ncbi:MAG: IS1595 family transposase [Gammaproteobacteria bacterium]|nr:IS1595 family transposase [Gammaproteobacteria bacterium]